MQIEKIRALLFETDMLSGQKVHRGIIMVEKNYGDEDFIYRMALRQRMPPHKNNIHDGYIMLGDEKILFKRQVILDGNLSMIMPEVFEVMPEEVASLKYRGENRPDLALTFLEGGIHFMLACMVDLPAEFEDYTAVRDLVERMVVISDPRSKIIDSAAMDANGRNIAYFDFVGDIYSMVCFFLLDGRIVVGSFDCPVSSKGDWKLVFLQMVGSVSACID